MCEVCDEGARLQHESLGERELKGSEVEHIYLVEKTNWPLLHSPLYVGIEDLQATYDYCPHAWPAAAWIELAARSDVVIDRDASFVRCPACETALVEALVPDPDASLRELGLSDYRPVYGSALTPDAFAPAAWCSWNASGVTSDGRPARYEIIVPPSSGESARLRIDGVPQSFQHPYTKELGVESAPLDVVLDLVGAQDAAGRGVGADRRWAGDDLPTVLSRIEHSVVRFDSSEVAVGSLSSLRELRDWLREALEATQLEIEVLAITHWPFEEGGRPRMEQFPHTDFDAGRRFFPRPLSTDTDPMLWLAGVRPEVAVSTSGRAILDVRSQIAVSWEALESTAVLDREDGRRAAWWAIRVLGTDEVIGFPRRGSNITVDTDGDGSRVRISAAPTREREAYHRRRARFEGEWARWLDPTVDLTNDELRRGIAQAERLVSAGLAAEVEG